jgi:hypothetical protein
MTDLCTFFAACTDIESLEIYGCSSTPTVRLCHGCGDLFTKVFTRLHYPNLSILVVNSIHISGGRLRDFVKRHAATLVEVVITSTTLTDGTWRSIAQGLARCPQMVQLRLESLRQKQYLTVVVTRPSNYVAWLGVNVKDAEEVQLFLKTCIAFFGTVSYPHYRLWGKRHSDYYEARLFQLPGTSVPWCMSEAVSVVRRYAEVDEIVEA